jgi:parallel beta-helix repeat protein
MKKRALTILGLLIFGTAISIASEGNVEIKNVINVTKIKNSDIKDSSVGMSISANGANVKVENNVNQNSIKNSTIKNSKVGIHVQGSEDIEIRNNVNVADIENSVLDGVNVGISRSTSNKKIKNDFD